MNPHREAIPEGAIAALENGKKIEAIKLTRQATGMHLKESKEAVELYIESNPALSEKFRARSGWPLLLLVLAAAAFGIYVSGIFG